MATGERTWGVLSGGSSPERDVSLASGRFLVERLRHHGYDCRPVILPDDPIPALAAAGVDGFIVALHGGWGEDGRLQAALDLMGVPYSGSRPKASMLAMDKALSKRLFTEAGVPTPRWRLARSMEDAIAARHAIPMPWVVKPASGGSSIGVQMISEENVRDAMRNALSTFGEMLIEQYIPGKILTVAVLDLPSGFRVLDPLEIRPSESLLYDERTKTLGLRAYGPPSFDDRERQAVVGTAAMAHRTLGCSGITRVDCIHSATLGPVVLEVNTVPGMEPNGNLLQACTAAGIGEREFLGMLVESVL